MRTLATSILVSLALLIIGGCTDKPAPSDKELAKTPDKTTEAPAATPATAEPSAKETAPKETTPPAVSKTWHELKDLGVKVEAPATWKLQKVTDGMYKIQYQPMGGRMYVVMIKDWSFPASPEDATKGCENRKGKVLDTKKLSEDRMMVHCEYEDLLSGGALTSVDTWYQVKGGKAINCAGNHPKDMKSIEEVCLSIVAL